MYGFDCTARTLNLVHYYVSPQGWKPDNFPTGNSVSSSALLGVSYVYSALLTCTLVAAAGDDRGYEPTLWAVDLRPGLPKDQRFSGYGCADSRGLDLPAGDLEDGSFMTVPR